MAEQLQLRRNTAANVASFTGAQGEVVVDTTNNRLVVQDGATAGGFPAAKLSEVAALAGAAFTGTLVAAVGTTTLAPVTLQSGTNLTAAGAGDFEYDGKALYFSVAASTRGVIPAEQFIASNSPYTLTSQTAAQQLFNVTTSGTVTLPVGAYLFECAFSLTSMSATSGTFGFALGGTATFTTFWQSIAEMLGTSYQQPSAVAAQASLTASSTSTTGTAFIKGFLRVTVGGALIPQVSLSVAAAAVVAKSSYFKISALGASGANSVGNWS